MNQAILAPALTWLPDLGMGHLEVREAPYDSAYFEKYQTYAATPMGRAITQARVDLVGRHAPKIVVVDVGIGCGDFVAQRPRTFGYDVNPAGIAWLVRRGLWWDPYESSARALTCWDSLEHVEDPVRLVAAAQEWLFCSLPIVPGAGPPASDWRHLRPDEHRWYWTHAGFLAWTASQGFECAEHNTMETSLGRLDIGTYALRRVR